MDRSEWIPASQFCTHYQVDISFVRALQDYGLIEVTTVEATELLHCDQLQKLEQLVRLHFELDINLEGIDAIVHLLGRIEAMQDEIVRLKNRLQVYEQPEPPSVHSPAGDA